MPVKITMKPGISTDPRLLAVLAHFNIQPDDTDTVNDSGNVFADFLVREATKRWTCTPTTPTTPYDGFWWFCGMYTGAATTPRRR